MTILSLFCLLYVPQLYGSAMLKSLEYQFNCDNSEQRIHNVATKYSYVSKTFMKYTFLYVIIIVSLKLYVYINRFYFGLQKNETILVAALISTPIRATQCTGMYSCLPKYFCDTTSYK